MGDLTHLFKVGQEVVCLFDGVRYAGIVIETQTAHIIVNVPDVSDHCYFDSDMLDLVYPAYNFAM